MCEPLCRNIEHHPHYLVVIEKLPLNPSEEDYLERLLAGVENKQSYALRFDHDIAELIKIRPILRPGTPRFASPETIKEMLVKALAITISNGDVKVRAEAAYGLIQTRQIPEVHLLLSDITQFYPVPAIRERAKQILHSQDLPPLCRVSFDLSCLHCVYGGKVTLTAFLERCDDESTTPRDIFE